MPQYAHDVTSVNVRNERDHGIAKTATDRHDRQELAHTVIPCRTSGREEDTRWKRKWNCRRCGERARPVAMKAVQKPGHARAVEFALQVSASGAAREPKRQVRADYRARRRYQSEFVPGMAARRYQEDDQDVGSAQSWKGRAIENRQREKAEGAEMSEDNSPTVRPAGRGLDQTREHKNWMRKAGANDEMIFKTLHRGPYGITGNTMCDAIAGEQ